MDKPNERSVHIDETPNLGGIGIFLSLILALTFLGSIFNYNNLLCLIGALVVLFFTGLKDDLITITPWSKLFGQIVATLGVILITDLRINSFYGLFGINELSYITSVLFTVFVFIAIINAFNLIDGVDGLAGSIGITTSAIFGIYFYTNLNDSMFFVSFSLIGALISFLFFNFSKKQKIFMGDTGSLIIGFTLAYQAISFIKVSHMPDSNITFPNAPIITLAIFIFPIIDTLRVFAIRIYNKRSPFSADKNHIHHVLIALGLRHWQIAAFASSFTVISVFTVITFSSIGIHTSFAVFITVALLLFFFISLFSRLKSRNEHVSSQLKPKPQYKTLQLKSLFNTMLSYFISFLLWYSL